MADTIHSVNLIVDKKDALLNQFLTWAVSVGRLLVILTECLALGVFLYRFSLDMQIVDLHDKIKQASAIVRSFNNAEAEFRNLHVRLSSAKSYDTHDDTVLLILQDLITLGRGRVTFKNLIITKKSLTIEAQSSIANNLSRFVQEVKEYAKVTSLTIDKVQSKPTSALIIVSLSGELQQDQ